MSDFEEDQDSKPFSHDGSDLFNVADADQNNERETLAKKEDKAVRWLRVCVFLLLVATATLVSLFIFNYVRTDQEEDFKHDFDANGAKLIEAFQTTMLRKVEGLAGLASSITSYAMATGASWPNVTVPNYEILAANARILAEVSVINFQPLVTDQTRAGWEAYAAERMNQVFQDSCESDKIQRAKQDAYFASNGRRLQEQGPIGAIWDLGADGTPVIPAPQAQLYLPSKWGRSKML